MGRWKLSIAIFTVLDTIWWMKELAGIPKRPHQVTYDAVARLICRKRACMSIAIFTVLDTIWWMKELAAIPKWASSGHLRRCITTDM
eukprot:scaffold8639_cov112-Skeletonema_marinoi.AAC.2